MNVKLGEACHVSYCEGQRGESVVCRQPNLQRLKGLEIDGIWFGAFIGLSKDFSLVPSSHMVAPNYPVSNSKESDALF